MKKIINVSKVFYILVLIGCGGSSTPTPTPTSTPTPSISNNITTYADEGGTVPEVEDYVDAGVTGVDEDNIDEVNDRVSEVSSEEVDTEEELQSLVDEVNDGRVLLDEPSVEIEEEADVVAPDEDNGSNTLSQFYLFDKPLTLPDSFGMEDVFQGRTPLQMNYKIIRSEKAVTISDYHRMGNQNSKVDGRYLFAGVTDIEHNTLVSFKKEQIINALGSDIPLANLSVQILKIELYLWIEKGSEVELELWKMNRTYAEDTIKWESDSIVDRYKVYDLDKQHFMGSAGWQKFSIPVNLFRAWLEEGSGDFDMMLGGTDDRRVHNGHHVVFSSDETTRPPSLVIHRLGTEETRTPIMEALGMDYDNEKSTIEYSFTPENPVAGERVTITATAKDNEALDYVSIKNHSGTVAYKEAVGTQSELTLTYETTATLPSMRFGIKADDVSGNAPSSYQYFAIPVRGNNANPRLTVNLDYEIKDVVPRNYRFIKNDGQKVDISFTASDPDGIEQVILDINGKQVAKFNPSDSPTVYTRTFSWVNKDIAGTTTHPNDINWTEFSYRFQVRDKEGRNTVVHSSENYDILDYHSLALYNNALTFGNYSKSKIVFDPYMKYTFGTNEVEGNRGNPKLVVAGVHEAFIKRIGKRGVCYGMSATSIELAKKRRLVPENLDNTATLSKDLNLELDPWVSKYIESKHISQFSDLALENTVYSLSMRLLNAGITTDLSLIDGGNLYAIKEVYNDLSQSASNWGILSVTDLDVHIVEDDKFNLNIANSHALVPWMIRKVEPHIWKVYVYDSNFPQGPKKVQKSEEISFDEPADFPYITVNLANNTWQYRGGSTIYSNFMTYVKPASVKGDSAALNVMNQGGNLYLADQDLPNVGTLGRFGIDLLTFTGERIVDGAEEVADTVVGAVVSVGRAIGGFFKKETKNINNSMPMPLLLPDAPAGMGAYTVKNDESYQIEFSGKKDGLYSTNIDKKRFSLSIKGKRIEKGLVDTLLIKNSSKDGDFSFVFTPQKIDDKFEIKIVHKYLDLKDGIFTPISKLYTLSNIQFKSGTPISVSFEQYADKLIIDKSDKFFNLNLKVEKQLGDEGKVVPYLNQEIHINGKEAYTYYLK